jgi:uncharacterized membrane protein HdeD (DUF308 family)
MVPVPPTKKSLRHGWVFLLTGILLIFAGLVALYDPLLTGRALGITLGILVFLMGVSHISFAVANRHLPHFTWHIVLGILDLVIGAFLLPYPDITIVVLPFLLGFWFLIRGISMIFYAFTLRHFTATGSGWTWLLIGGIFIGFFSLFVIWFPLFGFLTVVTWTAMALIVTGISNILLAFRFKDRKLDEEQTIIL